MAENTGESGPPDETMATSEPVAEEEHGATGQSRGDKEEEDAIGKSEAGEEEEDVNLDLSESALALREKEKKKKKREERKKKDAQLRKHYGTADIEVPPSAEEQSYSEGEAESQEIGAEKDSRDDRESVIHKDGKDLIPDKDEFKTGESSSEEENYVRPECRVSFKDDFLSFFYMPSISDLSSASSTEPEITKRVTEVETRLDSVKDVGHFVDPLTGEMVESDDEKQVEEKVEEESDEEEASSSSSISFDWPFPLEDEPVVVQVIDDADLAMEMLMEIQPPVEIIKVESTTALERARVERENRQICVDFLFKVIDDAVETAEYVDPLKVLRPKLDKLKLITHLHDIIYDYMAAKQLNTDISNKMYEYYRRVGQMRVFDPLPLEIDVIEYQRQKEALYKLDHMKLKAKQTMIVNNYLMASVFMDLSHASNIAISTIDSLEHRIRATLLRKDFDVMPRIVENELRRMQSMRNEISDNRLWLITRQHTLGRLLERKRNFDQITPDLTMDQFINAQREVSALGTKVEERNHDLVRMRDRCTKHVHQLAFIREKTSMISATLVTRKMELNEMIVVENILRDQVLRLKLHHARLKDQKKELQERCGLLHKPALLYDFDKTIEIVEVKRERVRGLRNTVQELETRIRMFEGRTRTTIKH